MPILVMLALLVGMVTSAAAQADTRYTSANSNLREAPSSSAAVLRVLPHGSAVTAACDGDWCRVTTGSGLQGYVSRSLLRDTRPSAPRRSDAQIRRILIQESIDSYYGSCPCPYHADRAGRSCGRRSAYTRPGGAAPLCYASDVSAGMVRAYRERAGQ